MPRSVAIVLFVALALASSRGSPAAAAGCRFVLGFAALHDAMPALVGDCLADERLDGATGDTVQPTTGVDGRGGLLVRRRADGRVAYTDGERTWVVGPSGIESRPNGQRFAWESGICGQPPLTAPALLNGEYTLPVGRGQEVAVRLSQGSATLPDGLGTVRLTADQIAFGDLDADGCTDALVVLAHDPGGSGTFVYAVPVLSRDGRPQPAGRELLGDRVRVEQVVVAGGVGTVVYLTHGPRDPLCCPARRVTATIRPGSGDQPGPAGLGGVRWRLVESRDGGAPRPAAPGTSVTATFGADGVVTGSSGCNSYRAGYSAAGGHIAIGPAAVTAMQCSDPAATAQESAYLRNLGAATDYAVVGPRLELRASDGATLVVLTP